MYVHDAAHGTLDGDRLRGCQDAVARVDLDVEPRRRVPVPTLDGRRRRDDRQRHQQHAPAAQCAAAPRRSSTSGHVTLAFSRDVIRRRGTVADLFIDTSARMADIVPVHHSEEQGSPCTLR